MRTDNSKIIYSQVVGFLEKLPVNEYQKIPNDLIEYYKSNMDKNYYYDFDYRKDIDCQDMKKETRAIIVGIYKEYLASEEQKNQIDKRLVDNFKQEEENKLKKYNPNNIFDKENKVYESNKDSKNELTILQNDEKIGFFKKLLERIKMVLINRRKK